MEPMASVTLVHFLLTSAILFVIGLIGFVSRRNLIVMFLCTELMFQAAAIAMIAFGRYHADASGQVFVIFILTVAAAEAVLALVAEFPVSLELAGVILLMAMYGAVIFARRQIEVSEEAS